MTLPTSARHCLHAALDHWDVCEPQRRQIYEALNSGAFSNPEPFDTLLCHSPLNCPLSSGLIR